MSALGCIGLGPATHFHSSDFSAFLSASSSFLRERFECAPCIASHSSRSLACARAEYRRLRVGARGRGGRLPCGGGGGGGVGGGGGFGVGIGGGVGGGGSGLGGRLGGCEHS